MCGIVVEISKTKTRSYIREMVQAISHRGSNAPTIHDYGKTKIGFVRLPITEIEHEPVFKGWEVFLNGEIYNYKELGYEGSEVEVISKGLEAQGLDFVKKLNGMFFIVAISPKKELFCFRDRYGIKPAYFYEGENVKIISSEIKAILAHPGYKFGVNVFAEQQWGVFNNYLNNSTLFLGVEKIEKGTVFDVLRDKKYKFWSWEFKPEKMDYTKAKKRVRELVIQAIQRQTPKEVDYCTSLSGGVDSGIIQTLTKAESYTVGFKGVKDETERAKLVNIKTNLIIFERVTALGVTVRSLEDLRVGASWMHYGLFKEAAKKYKVIFDGAGADELFGGYSWRYKAEDYYSVVNRTGVESTYCRHIFNSVFKEDTLENRYLFDAEFFLEGVLLAVDKLSMANTMEVRVPFLDNDLVDFCLKLPTEFKKDKKILKEAFEDLLPEEVVKGEKRGFSAPDWIEGEGNQAKKWADKALEIWLKIYNK